MLELNEALADKYGDDLTCVTDSEAAAGKFRKSWPDGDTKS